MTFEYDPEVVGPYSWGAGVQDHVKGLAGVDPFSVTVKDLPDPPIVQRFIVEVEAPAEWVPLSVGTVRSRVADLEIPDRRKVTVTEVTDA